MRSALAAVVAAATVGAAAVGAGCVIVTGSTDGYRVQDSGGGDGGGNVSLQCVSAVNCGDGGEVCCLVVNSSGTGAITVCQAAPCSGAFPVQMCQSTPECGETGLCTKQTCSLGSTVTINACGVINGCTP
jgi:hypothetical protein